MDTLGIAELERVGAAYGIPLKTCVPAPRGFWAETYRVGDGEREYFLKLHKNYPWMNEFAASLELQCAMAERVGGIPKPYRTTGGSPLLELDGGACALYEYIDGAPYLTRDASEIFALLLGIYTNCAELKPASAFKYKRYADEETDALETGVYTARSSAFGAFIERNRGVYTRHRRSYAELYDRFRDGAANRFITHGDLAKNLMRDVAGRLYIVDWDRTRMGPPELDLYEFTDGGTDIAELDKMAADAGVNCRFDARLHDYFTLNKLYYDLRNLVNADRNGGITDEGELTGHQAFIDSLPTKLLSQ